MRVDTGLWHGSGMAEPHPLAHLEKSNHFYNRGRDTTRLEAFVDAAFAFALTLLVISFDAVPTNYNELITALKSVPAFVSMALAGFCLPFSLWILYIAKFIDCTFDRKNIVSVEILVQ